MRRIVITGMGLVTPLGLGVETVWSRLLASRSGLRRLPDEIVGDLPAKVGGAIPRLDEDELGGLDLDRVVASKDQRRMDRFIVLALAAAEEAIAQSGWRPNTEQERQKTATIIASAIGGFLTITDAVDTVRDRGARRLSPFTIPAFLVNLAAGHVSIKYGFKGAIGAPVTACAASVQAIGDAARLVRTGEADVAICGGAEACISTVSIGSFVAARALSTGFNDKPTEASRPFDERRDGFVMGEGAGIVVVEDLEHAIARGARPLAEIIGYGTTSDAFHITSGPEDGNGARRAMTMALDQARLPAKEVQHLNAHATSTPVGDRGEMEAIKAVFGHEGGIAVSATKSSTGHLLGAAGGMEAIFTALALRDQVAPPTLNLQNADAAASGMDIVCGAARSIAIEHAISNGFGFGGVNASLLLRGMG
jgi:3-oxoacyl-[acyl-carrier-protein] synthase II